MFYIALIVSVVIVLPIIVILGITSAPFIAFFLVVIAIGGLVKLFEKKSGGNRTDKGK